MNDTEYTVTFTKITKGIDTAYPKQETVLHKTISEIDFEAGVDFYSEATK